MKQREALKLALETLELLHPLTCHDRITAIRKALAQPEQEPSELDIWKSRALQAEAVIEKFMAQQPEPVIDKSAAERIATALGWEPKRKPLEGVIDVQPIGYHSLQLIFRSQTDIAKFKAAHGIKE